MGNQSSLERKSSVSNPRQLRTDILGHPLDSAKDALRPLNAVTADIAAGGSHILESLGASWSGADTPDHRSAADQVVVVNRPAPEHLPDAAAEELVQMSNLPVFVPIIASSVMSTEGRSLIGTAQPEGALAAAVGVTGELTRLSPRHVNAAIGRLEEYLRQNADSVVQEQTAIAARLKEVEYVSAQVRDVVTERQRAMSRFEQQLQKVQDLGALIGKLDKNLQKAQQLVLSLHLSLPPEHRLAQKPPDPTDQPAPPGLAAAP